MYIDNRKQDSRQHNEQKGRARQLLFNLDPRTIEQLSGLGFKKILRPSTLPQSFHSSSFTRNIGHMSDKPQVGREIKRERRAVFYDKYNWPTMSISIYSRTNRVFSFYDYWAAIFDNLVSDIVICCAIFPKRLQSD